MGSKKAMIAKVKNILKTLPEGQITQPSIKHLAATGLSENNIKLLQSINITYDNLDNLNFKLFSNLTSDNIRESTYQRIMKAYTEFEALVFIDKNNGNATSTNKEALLKII
ncbi:HTH cro/C1-type domain-containing protein OS=Lysinibacillus sphaericus OX=1421 GN=LS41612_04830 PE=4 SV=1 [Lysinibacillus sphaericus]